MSSSLDKSADAFSYPLTTARDEAYDSDGYIQPYWRYLLHSLHGLGADVIEDRYQKTRRLLRDDGATYRVYQRQDDEQPWQLNPIPLLINSEEWAYVESGLIERAELLNALLRDIYGDRQLVREGIVPPELLVAQQSFLRACQRLPDQHHQPLIIHAADLVRAHNGQIQVMGDRTQAPSGAGYALENRNIMTRVFPSLFRDSHVHRLSPFFSRLRQQLQRINPNGGLARIVVLTPGIYNEAYFEHAYLASHLGFQLVQGSDLTVRNGYVWMKALDGLKRVDVILRRVDDTYCDPVEFRGDSRLGVPGLAEVARNHRVALANPLGSGILENPGLLRYLPDISEALLGRPLQLPSVKTWWCGDKQDLDYVCRNLRSLIIKPTFRRAGRYEVYGAELDNTKLTAWINRIRKNPYQYAAQEYVPASTTPTWDEGRLQARPTLLRTFSVASDNSYAVMPGGLTRVNVSPTKTIISNQYGSASKDTWVLASEPEKQSSLRRTSAELQAESSSELPSRIIENLFWVGRYSERAEASLRLLRTLFLQFNKTEKLPDSITHTLLYALTHVTGTYPGFTAFTATQFKQPDAEIVSIILDRERIGSIAHNLSGMMLAAEHVKEHLSSDTQRVINNIDDQLNRVQQELSAHALSAPDETLAPLVTTLLAFAGLIHESMPRGAGWHFMEIGRKLERALQIMATVRALVTAPMSEGDEEVLVESCLLSTDALAPYKRRYQSGTFLKPGLEMILLNAKNPRSLLYQFEQLHIHCHALPSVGDNISPEMKCLLEATTALKLCDIDALMQPNDLGNSSLANVLSTLQQHMYNAAAIIAQRYFDHTEGPQLLVKHTYWQE